MSKSELKTLFEYESKRTHISFNYTVFGSSLALALTNLFVSLSG